MKKPTTLEEAIEQRNELLNILEHCNDAGLFDLKTSQNLRC